MSKAILLVSTNPRSEDREDEYNEWYNETHLGELLAIPGVSGAKRYVLSDVPGGSKPPAHRYVAIYEVETDDVQSVADELGRRVKDGSVGVSSAIDADFSSNFFIAVPGGER